MAYVSRIDVEAFSGYGAQDFKQGSLTMTASQWEDYCTNDLIPRIEQMIHRYCGVPTFDEHTVIELKNTPEELNCFDPFPSGLTPGGQVVEQVEPYEFLLVEPCISVASVAIKPNIWVSSWEDLIEVGSYEGEYFVATQDELTHVYLNRVPMKGPANIRITYQAGYETGSPQLQGIALLVLRIIRINLEEKLKFQQAGTIRNANVRDYLEMYDINKEKHKDQYYIPPDIQYDLNRYRRLIISQGL